MANTPQYHEQVMQSVAHLASDVFNDASSAQELSDEAKAAAGETFTKAIEVPKSQLDTSITASAIADADNASVSTQALKDTAKNMPPSKKQDQQQEALDSDNKLNRYRDTTSTNEATAKPGDPTSAASLMHG